MRCLRNALGQKLIQVTSNYNRIRPLLRYVVVGATIMVNMLLNMAPLLKRVLDFKSTRSACAFVKVVPPAVTIATLGCCCSSSDVPPHASLF